MRGVTQQRDSPTAPTPQRIEINVNGATDVSNEAQLQTLAGQPDDMNSIESPQKVAPEKSVSWRSLR